MTTQAQEGATAGHEAATDGASKLKGLAWLLGFGGFAVIFAVGLGPLMRAVPWSWEVRLAEAVEMTPPASCHANPGAPELLQKLVTRLYPVQPDDGDFSVEVHVVKSSVVNAFAGLGGQITLNSGLLLHAESAEEVAGVLAHEMEHVHRRHILQGAVLRLVTSAGVQLIFSSGDPSMSEDWANYFITMSFTRDQEAQADEGGLKRLQKAHIDNSGFKHFFQRMEDSSVATQFLSDHPSSESRAELVDDFKNDAPQPIMTREEWSVLKHYCR